jgi:hypothetical protein
LSDRRPFPTNFAIWCAYEALYRHLQPFANFVAVWTMLGAAALLAVPLAESIVMWPFVGGPTAADELIASIPRLWFVVTIGAAICISISWHRFIILNEPPGRPLPAPVTVIWDYAWRNLILTVLPWFVAVPAVAFLVPDGLLNAMAWNAAISIGVPVMIAALAPLMLVLPASAVGDHRVTFRESRRLTRGSFVLLFRGALACSLPFVLATLTLSELSADIDEDTVGAYVTDYVMTVIDLMSAVVSSAFISFAYLHFTEGTPSDRSPESYFA